MNCSSLQEQDCTSLKAAGIGVVPTAAAAAAVVGVVEVVDDDIRSTVRVP